MRIPAEFHERLRKLAELRKRGINPYVDRYEADTTCQDAYRRAEKSTHTAKDLVGAPPKNVMRIRGRLMSVREHGKLTFGHLQDFTGTVQVCFVSEILGKDTYDLLLLIDRGDIIGIEGEPCKTDRGEPTIVVRKWQVLTKTLRPLPEKWHGLQDPELKYRKRYLELIMDRKAFDRFLLRTRVINIIREHLDQHGFVEIETPVLSIVPSGAAARPFTTHHWALDFDLFLRIAPETYLKRALVGGFERVYEFAKCFRNEGMDPSHLQEFLMLEWYAAYWNFEDTMRFIEELFARLLRTLFGTLTLPCIDRGGKEQEIDFTPPWPRITVNDLIKRDTGIDLTEAKTAEDLHAFLKKKKINLEDVSIEKLGRGNLIDALYKKMCRPKLVGPLFITHHPTDVSPLSRRNDRDPSVTDRFQLLVNTWEIINAFSEVTDPVDQRQRLEEQAKLRAAGDEEAMPMDEDFVQAIEHGMPPCCGVGIGIDRLVTLFTRQDNLKDCVLFPLLKPIE